MLVDKKELEKLAHTAKISLEDKAFAERIESDLHNILEFVAEINKVDTSEVAVMEHSQSETLRTRDDLVTESNQRAEMQKDIPDSYHADGLYLVPKVVE